MKRLTLLLLFLTCHCFLQLQQGEAGNSRLHTNTGYFSSLTLSATSSNVHLAAHGFQEVKPWRELFKRRPIGLNDGHEHALAVYSCDTRPLFVYIHTRYRTYAQTFRNVAINLSDWRGPPEMLEV
ncbi:MAG TPA: hypothetical protein VGE90_06315 [Chitinophaga sp.]